MGKEIGKESFHLHPIGYVRRGKDDIYLEILEKYRPALKQLEHFSHIIVFWWADKHDNAKDRSKLQTKPPYANDKLTGVFACRSEYRPNPIAMTTCKILEVDEKKGHIQIGNIDAYVGTIVLDLKPYIPVSDRLENVEVPKWLSNWPEWITKDGLGLKM